MIRPGDMVRHGGGPMMKVADIFRDMVRCIFVDGHGQVRQRFAYADDLTPAWLSFQPRCLWPEANDMPPEEETKPPVTKRKKPRRPRPSKRARAT